MKRKNKSFYFYLFVGMLFLLGGCKTSRPAGPVTLAKMGKEERIESLQYQSPQYNTLLSSLKFNLKPGLKKNAMSANAQLKIIKDKAIQLSVRIPVLGTEIARMTITPEQITIIDRSNKRYVSESMETFQRIISFDFDFYSLQALFTNQLFIAGKSALAKEDYPAFQWTESEFLVTLNHTDRQGIRYDFTSDFSNRVIRTEMYKNKSETNMQWAYRDFLPASDNRLFPMKMSMELAVPDDLITLNLAFNHVNIDADFEIDTAIPNKYQPVGIEQIIRLIQSF
jgi:hypothetical protein